MKALKSSLVILGSVGLLFLGACSNSDQGTGPNSSPAASPVVSQPNTSSSAASPAASAKTEPPKPSKGGQVVESGPYHLELVPEKEDNGTHLDFYLQKGDTHEAIPNAKVTAQVQIPDGTQKTLELTYDAEGKHYAVLLPDNTSGQYQVKITSDINGEKVNGRFSFNK